MIAYIYMGHSGFRICEYFFLVAMWSVSFMKLAQSSIVDYIPNYI